MRRYKHFSSYRVEREPSGTLDAAKKYSVQRRNTKFFMKNDGIVNRLVGASTQKKGLRAIKQNRPPVLSLIGYPKRFRIKLTLPCIADCMKSGYRDNCNFLWSINSLCAWKCSCIIYAYLHNIWHSELLSPKGSREWPAAVNPKPPSGLPWSKCTRLCKFSLFRAFIGTSAYWYHIAIPFMQFMLYAI